MCLGVVLSDFFSCIFLCKEIAGPIRPGREGATGTAVTSPGTGRLAEAPATHWKSLLWLQFILIWAKQISLAADLAQLLLSSEEER